MSHIENQDQLLIVLLAFFQKHLNHSNFKYPFPPIRFCVLNGVFSFFHQQFCGDFNHIFIIMIRYNNSFYKGHCSD
jgi:hypothetical protein